MGLYCFMDFETQDFSVKYPNIYPGIGGVRFFTWTQFNPAPGLYNTQIVEDWLAKEGQIKLQNGSKKPLITFLFCHGAPKNDDGKDYSPDWVKQLCPTKTITIQIKSTDDKGNVTYTDSSCLMPAYDNPMWWSYLEDAIRAFGAILDGRVDYIAIAHGCDAELWEMKAPWNQKTSGEIERAFSQGTVRMFDVYKEAFPNTKLIANSTPGSGHKLFTQTAIEKGIGYHMCGAQQAAQNAEGWGNEYGTWTGMVDAKAKGLPVVAETTSGMGNKRRDYWMILGMLGAGHIDAFDVHPEHLSYSDASFWNWAITHMGVTAKTTPSAWCVLRDYDPKFPPREWTSQVPPYTESGQSDWRGDFRFFMKGENEDALRVTNIGPDSALPYPQSRLVRKSTFYIDEIFGQGKYKVQVTWLQQDNRPLTIEWINRSDEVQTHTWAGEGSNTWKTTETIIDSHSFVLRSSGVAVHMVEAFAEEGGGEPDMAVISESVEICELALSDATKWLTNANSELAAAQREVSWAKGFLIDATTAVDNANSRVDQARVNQRTAQEQIDAANAQLAKIRAELEKAP